MGSLTMSLAIHAPFDGGNEEEIINVACNVSDSGELHAQMKCANGEPVNITDGSKGGMYLRLQGMIETGYRPLNE